MSDVALSAVVAAIKAELVNCDAPWVTLALIYILIRYVWAKRADLVNNKANQAYPEEASRTTRHQIISRCSWRRPTNQERASPKLGMACAIPSKILVLPVRIFFI